MNLTRIQTILRRKPPMFLVLLLSYCVLLALARWTMHPTWGTLLFLLGGIIGTYFLDLAEVFFELTPSPFRSIVFCVAFGLVSLFIITSSVSFVAQGLVLTMYLTILLWQTGEWQTHGNLDSWYRAVAVPVSAKTQQIGMIVFAIIFFIESIVFMRG